MKADSDTVKYGRLSEIVREVLPAIEEAARSNKAMLQIRDKIQEFFDIQSKPLRDAVDEWGKERGDLGRSGGWYASDRVWRFTLGGETVVQISEDGEVIKINGVLLQDATPRKLKSMLRRCTP